MIDSLAHLADPRLGDINAVCRRAHRAGIMHIVVSDIDPRRVAWPVYTSPTARSPTPSVCQGVRLWRAAGLHPSRVDAQWTQALRLLERHIGGLLAIGEIGLDGRLGMPPAALQEAALLAQLELARHHNLPVILHNVGRTGRMLALVEKGGRLAAGGVLHGFTGPAECVIPWSVLNVSFSFGGRVTRPAARRCRQAAIQVADERLLVESDAPDQPISSHLGTGEPADLPAIVAVLAALRGVSAPRLAAQTARNAAALYKIPATRDNR